jgi:hypothetical protein
MFLFNDDSPISVCKGKAITDKCTKKHVDLDEQLGLSVNSRQTIGYIK